MSAGSLPALGELLGAQADALRCLTCHAPLRVAHLAEVPAYPDLGPDGILACVRCGERYPLIGGTPRMLDARHHRRLVDAYPEARAVVPEPGHLAPDADDDARVKHSTADSFAYEWERFGALREEWARNFADYLRPHRPSDLRDRDVLDVGAGSGRHSFHADAAGARVTAVDLGGSIDVARRNLPPSVLTVQADAERLPFEPESFDFVLSIGVLHHLSDPARALRSVAGHARPGGHVHVYLYWVPQRDWHRRVLRGVTAARRVTVLLPHRVLHLLCLPLAALLHVGVVAPYRALRRRPRSVAFADALPLKTYADYPFSVLVNDQFDRFSAPLERRYTAAEVGAELQAAGLEDIVVLPNHGWVGDGRVPLTSPRGAGRPPG